MPIRSSKEKVDMIKQTAGLTGKRFIGEREVCSGTKAI